MSESLAIETVDLRKRLDATASVGIRKRTGFVDEHKALYDYMTVEEISGDVTARSEPRRST